MWASHDLSVCLLLMPLSERLWLVSIVIVSAIC